MSLDLHFWRQSPDLDKSPEEVLDLLSEDEPVRGVIAFPRKQVRAVLREAFPDIQDQDFDLSWEGPEGKFQIVFGHATETEVNLISVLCSDAIRKQPVVLRRLVNACAGLGCAVYDAEAGIRGSGV